MASKLGINHATVMAEPYKTKGTFTVHFEGERERLPRIGSQMKNKKSFRSYDCKKNRFRSVPCLSHYGKD
jgi:hypothetical protein